MTAVTAVPPTPAIRDRAARTGVVLLNFGSPEDTLTCLRSLELSHDLDLEILIVENGPPGEVSARLEIETAGRATVLCTGDNLGYAGGNNIGIRHVLDRGCSFVWILNPDTVVEPDTLPTLHALLASVPDCGIVGPRLLLPGRPQTIWFDGGIVDEQVGRTAHVRQGARLSTAPRPEAVDTDYMTGASMLVRRDVIETIGGIPEHYFLYFEEVDWCVRAQRAGWRTMIEQRAQMTHLKRSSGRLPTPYFIYYMTRNRYRFAQQCLGIDGELALDELDRTFLAGWRAKVLDRAPAWIEHFDDLVERAKRDARAGLHGRNDDIAHVPAPVEEDDSDRA